MYKGSKELFDRKEGTVDTMNEVSQSGKKFTGAVDRLIPDNTEAGFMGMDVKPADGNVLAV